MRRLFVALALLAAGCVAPPAAEDAPVTPARESLTYSGCEEHQWFGQAAGSAARSYLPEGFTFSGVTGQGVTASWTAWGYRCERLIVDGDDVGPVSEAMAALIVTPPDELAIDNGSLIGGYSFFLLVATTSPDALARYAEWGFPAVLADEATIDIAARAGDAATAEVHVRAGGVAVDATGVQHGPPAAWEGRFVRIFSVNGPLAADAQVVGWADAWVPSRAVMEDAATEFAFTGLTGAAADILPAHGAAPAVGWRMDEDAVAYELNFTRLP
jgi:hypothetical protein